MERALAGDAGTVIVEENFKGTHKFFEILHMPVQFPDGSRGMMAVSQDITDKKQLEMALRDEGKIYREIVEHLPAVIFALDAEGRIAYISPRVREYGYEPEILAGRPFTDLIEPDDRTAALTGLATARREGAVTGIRFRITDTKERQSWIELSCMAMRDEAGTCTGITGVFREMPVKASGGRKASRGK